LAEKGKALSDEIKSIDDPMDAMFYQPVTEVYYQTELQTRNPKISQELRFKNWVVCHDRFAVNNDKATHKKIDSKWSADVLAFVYDRKEFFGLDGYPASLNFQGESIAIYAFQQAWTAQRAVYFDSSIHNDLA
jgi:hypothetical protein